MIVEAKQRVQGALEQPLRVDAVEKVADDLREPFHLAF
jgi:hypothetical protein